MSKVQVTIWWLFKIWWHWRIMFKPSFSKWDNFLHLLLFLFFLGQRNSRGILICMYFFMLLKKTWYYKNKILGVQCSFTFQLWLCWGELSFSWGHYLVLFSSVWPLRYIFEDQPIVYEIKRTFIWVLRFVKL